MLLGPAEVIIGAPCWERAKTRQDELGQEAANEANSRCRRKISSSSFFWVKISAIRRRRGDGDSCRGLCSIMASPNNLPAAAASIYISMKAAARCKKWLEWVLQNAKRRRTNPHSAKSQEVEVRRTWRPIGEQTNEKPPGQKDNGRPRGQPQPARTPRHR